MAKKYHYTKKTGRPEKYSDVGKMQKKIDEYFASCFSPKTDKAGQIIHDKNGNEILEQVRPFTMAGLAYALGMSRTSLINYQRKTEFFHAITQARRRCEVYAEERLFDKEGCQGAKFSLINNYESWKDKSELDHGLADSFFEKFSNLDIEEIKKRANELIVGKPPV
jgi:hypothetical protein